MDRDPGSAVLAVPSSVAAAGDAHSLDGASEVVGDLADGAGVDVGGKPSRVMQLGEAEAPLGGDGEAVLAGGTPHG